MQNIIYRPSILLLIIFFISLIVTKLFPSLASTIFDIWILGICLIIAIFLHELGHVIFALLCRFNFHFFTFGPFLIEKVQGKLRIRENKHWIYFGGVSFVTPTVAIFSTIKAKWGLFLLGGPFFSFIAFLVFFMIGKIYQNDFMLWCSILNIMIFIGTSFPITKGEANDGGKIFLLFKDREQAGLQILKFQILSEMLSSKRPMEWDKDLIEKCKEIIKEKNPLENHMIYTFYTFLFYYYFDIGHVEQVFSSIQPIINEPLTKENKFIKGNFNSLYILYKFLYENNEKNLEEIDKLFKGVSKLDSYAYNRSLAIIKYLKGDVKGAKSLINKLEHELSYTNGQGVYHVEKDILQKLRLKMMI